MAGKKITTHYKSDFVDFIKGLDWDWCITIGIGACPEDDEALRRLRLIEATFCKRYLLNRYHRLSERDRFSTVVAFEGEKRLGTRHAHVLVHVPYPMKRYPSRGMLLSLFVWELLFLWHKLTPSADRQPFPWVTTRGEKPLMFGRANLARQIYTVKSVQGVDVPWSRFEFVTPPKASKFENENLSVIRNRDQQKRIAAGNDPIINIATSAKKQKTTMTIFECDEDQANCQTTFRLPAKMEPLYEKSDHNRSQHSPERL